MDTSKENTPVATKAHNVDEIIEKEMPGFRVAKASKSAADGVKVLAADAVTPNADVMRKYKMSAPGKKAAARGDAARGKSRMVAIEPKHPGSADGPSKRLAVIVKGGAIGPRQG